MLVHPTHPTWFAEPPLLRLSCHGIWGFLSYMSFSLPQSLVGHFANVSCAPQRHCCCLTSAPVVQLMGGEEQLVDAVSWIEQNLTFDLDKRVHVFELTIRALGEW